MLKEAVYSSDAPVPSSDQTPLCAKDVMTSSLQFAQADWSLRDLGAFFVKTKVSGAPVIDHKGEAVGVVTITDLAKHEQYNNPKETLEDVHRFYDEFVGQPCHEEDVESLTELSFLSKKVLDIMTPNLISVDVGVEAAFVAQEMVSKHVHRVLVTEKEKLVGIISSLDLLRFFR